VDHVVVFYAAVLEAEVVARENDHVVLAGNNEVRLARSRWSTDGGPHSLSRCWAALGSHTLIQGAQP
jgi:hypothetical protein